jgi:hypothetical protein
MRQLPADKDMNTEREKYLLLKQLPVLPLFLYLPFFLTSFFFCLFVGASKLQVLMLTTYLQEVFKEVRIWVTGSSG